MRAYGAGQRTAPVGVEGERRIDRRELPNTLRPWSERPVSYGLTAFVPFAAWASEPIPPVIVLMRTAVVIAPRGLGIGLFGLGRRLIGTEVDRQAEAR